MFEVPVVTGLEVDDDRHDVAQAQLPLRQTLALTTLEQTLLIEAAILGEWVVIQRMARLL
jgi:hypothetical protein